MEEQSELIEFGVCFLVFPCLLAQTISLGLSHSDGSIHLSFDNHNTSLVYRRSCSTLDLISRPDEVPYRDVVGGWSKKSFQEVREGLEGLDTAEFEVSGRGIWGVESLSV
jgi:hypothetical protein